jgi:hypothetical protein
VEHRGIWSGFMGDAFVIRHWISAVNVAHKEALWCALQGEAKAR